MIVICVLGENKSYLISKTCWTFSILMFYIIIFNNRNQVQTCKIQLQFILVGRYQFDPNRFKLTLLHGKFLLLLHSLIVIDFWIWLVNENFDNFFRSFHWKVYGIAKIVNAFFFTISVLSKSRWYATTIRICILISSESFVTSKE